MADEKNLRISIVRLAQLLQSPPTAGTAHELREKENIAKKSIIKIGNLLPVFDAFKTTFVECLLLIQLVTRMVATGRLINTDILDWLSEMVSDLHVNPALRQHGLQLIATLTLKQYRPDSLVNFLSKQPLTDELRLAVLAGIPTVLQLVEADTARLTVWSEQVLHLVCQNREQLEKWIEYIPGELLRDSGFINKIAHWNIEEAEEVIQKCCRKRALVPVIVDQIVDPLLCAGSTGSLVLASRYIGELRGLPSRVSDTLLTRLTEILANNPPVPLRLRMVEHILALFDDGLHLSVQAVEFLLAASQYPPGVEIMHPVPPKASQDDDEDSPVALYQRFVEVRVDVRKFLRSCPLEDSVAMQEYFHKLFESTTTVSNWFHVETVLHASSALLRRFPSAGTVGLPKLLGAALPLHRAVMCAFVVMMTSHIKSMPDDILVQSIRLALDCLSEFETTETSGWFPFRSKQDNSCVVFIQGLAAAKRPVPLQWFWGELVKRIDRIKTNLFYKDGFRQTRSIFIKSIVELLRTSPELILLLLPRICDDCEDVSVFVSECPEHKIILLPLIQPKLDAFVSNNSSGMETLIATYADMLDFDTIAQVFKTSRNSPGFRPRGWLQVAPSVANTHGHAWVLLLSNQIGFSVPVKQLTPEWFACLSLVPIVGREAFHIQWLMFSLTQPLRSDVFRAVVDYAVPSTVTLCKAGLADADKIFANLVLLLVQNVSSVNAEDSIAALSVVCQAVGEQASVNILHQIFPALKNEIQAMMSALMQKDLAKARRMGKKLVLAN